MSLAIVGGIYIERSVFPESEVIFGSGGRAAAALQKLDPSRTLHSFVGEDRSDDIRYHTDSVWQVHLVGYSVPETVSFSYYHGLSAPVIRPKRLPIPDADKFHVSEEHVLQYGMLEGTATVAAKRVVFDPQNPESPEFFDEHGSTADEIVYILNRGEARRLTGVRNPDDAAKQLLARRGVSTVVIKAGPLGAQVYTAQGCDSVNAHETDHIWPIGSGDVFAAVFAHYWLTERQSPTQSARLASRGTALYCDHTALPITPGQLRADGFYPELIAKRSPSEATIYLAGPFFTMGQLWLVEEARSAIKDAGYNVFSPFHDVGIGNASDVVPEDIEAIKHANVLLALCDGHDPGTIFEVGYAVRHGIPVVCFGEQTTDEAMKMFRGTGCKVFADFTSAIYHTQWEAIK